MNLIALAVCFLFIFCHGPRHRPVAHPHQETGRSVLGKSCAQITKGFESWDNTDNWVSEFPVEQQHRALVCLDEMQKKRPR